MKYVKCSPPWVTKPKSDLRTASKTFSATPWPLGKQECREVLWAGTAGNGLLRCAQVYRTLTRNSCVKYLKSNINYCSTDLLCFVTFSWQKKHTNSYGVIQGQKFRFCKNKLLIQVFKACKNICIVWRSLWKVLLYFFFNKRHFPAEFEKHFNTESPKSNNRLHWFFLSNSKNTWISKAKIVTLSFASFRVILLLY